MYIYIKFIPAKFCKMGLGLGLGPKPRPRPENILINFKIETKTLTE